MKLNNVNIWLTTKCNLKCSYCYVKKDGIDMNYDTAEKIVHYLKRNANYNVVIRFHGGEPTLKNDLMKYFITELVELNPKYAFTTNGTILTQEILDLVAENNISISVSVDGSKKIHDKYRVNANNEGTYNKTIKNLSKYKKIKGVIVRMTVTPETVQDLFEGYAELYNKGYRAVGFAPDITSEWNQESLENYDNQFRKILTLFSEEHKSMFLKAYKSLTFRSVKCNGGLSTVQIDVNGNIYPCTYTVGSRSEVCGSVKDGYNIEKYKKYLNKLEKIKIERCVNCEFNKVCKFKSCKLRHKVENGEYNLPSKAYCDIHRIEYKILNENGLF